LAKPLLPLLLLLLLPLILLLYLRLPLLLMPYVLLLLLLLLSLLLPLLLLLLLLLHLQWSVWCCHHSSCNNYSYPTSLCCSSPQVTLFHCTIMPTNSLLQDIW
jgi:hypothetical protein